MTAHVGARLRGPRARPGFTETSVYGKLWTASGLPYEQLLTRLVERAYRF